MRKIKEVLRLRYELGLAQRQIARSCSISRAAVSEYLERAEAAGLRWPLPEGSNDEQLEAELFRRSAAEPAVTRAVPDFAHLHEELQRHKHVTLQLLWEEYRQAHPDGYRYSFFCERYRQWKRKQDVGVAPGTQGRRESVCRLRTYRLVATTVSGFRKRLR